GGRVASPCQGWHVLPARSRGWQRCATSGNKACMSASTRPGAVRAGLWPTLWLLAAACASSCGTDRAPGDSGGTAGSAAMPTSGAGGATAAGGSAGSTVGSTAATGGAPGSGGESDAAANDAPSAGGSRGGAGDSGGQGIP